MNETGQALLSTVYDVGFSPVSQPLLSGKKEIRERQL